MSKTAEIPTLEVPSDIYQEALDFCNRRLREDGKPEITELPPGMPRDGESCPCGVACGIYVGTDYWWDDYFTYEADEDQELMNGKSPSRFVALFDKLPPRRLTLPIRAKARTQEA